MIIRPAAAADSGDVAAVVEAVHAEYSFAWEPDGYGADLYDLGTHYLDRGHLLWVASDGLGIQGVVALELFERVPGTVGSAVSVGGTVRLAGCDAALVRLYVHPDARRRGAGSGLLSMALDAARQEGSLAIEIWSDKLFGHAHRLYERFGARRLAERVIPVPEPCEEWGLVIDVGGGTT